MSDGISTTAPSYALVVIDADGKAAHSIPCTEAEYYAFNETTRHLVALRTQIEDVAKAVRMIGEKLWPHQLEHTP